MAMNLRLENRINASLEMLSDLYDKFAALTKELDQAKHKAIPASIRRQIASIERRYNAPMVALRKKIDDLDMSIRTDTISYGQSVKNAGYHAVYAGGRITWNTAGLNGYAVVHPEVLEFQRDSGPYITIRKVKS